MAPHPRAAAAVALASCLCAPALALTAQVPQLAHVVDTRTMFGSTAMVPQANVSDPVFLTTTWVYDPLEIVAYEDGAPLWRLDTSADGRQMWAVRGGASAATAPGKLNAAAYWIEKDNGIEGNCSLAVFNAARSPVAPGNGWRIVLLADTCALVNLALSTASYVDLSRDGLLVAALSADDTGNLTVRAFDAQTGRLRWARSIAPTKEQAQMWTFSGVSVSANAELVTWACGELESAAGVRQYVVHASNGTDVAPTVRSDGELEPPLSPDGEYTVASIAVASGGDSARVMRWNASTRNYDAVVPDLVGPASVGVSGWYLVQAKLTFDPMSATTFVTLAWSSMTLDAAAVTMYDVDALAGGPVASYATPVSTGAMDSSGCVIACLERLCVAGFYPGSGVAQPTVLLLDASAAGPVWNTTTSGSVIDVSIAPAEVPETYFFSSSGCTTPSICTDVGAEAYVWAVEFVA